MHDVLLQAESLKTNQYITLFMIFMFFNKLCHFNCNGGNANFIN